MVNDSDLCNTMEYWRGEAIRTRVGLLATECKEGPRKGFPIPPNVEGDGNVLKKVGVVAAAVVGFSMIAAPAFAAASPADERDMPGLVEEGSYPTFGDAYNTFIIGGGALGYGAASLVAGAFTGIATTPALIAHSFAD